MAKFQPGRQIGATDRPIIESVPTRRISQHIRKVVTAAEAGDPRASAVLLSAAILAKSAVATQGVPNG